MTGHRRENFGEGFENICAALIRIAQEISDVEIVYPVHLNPRVMRPVNDIIAQKQITNIHLTAPVDYLSFVYLMARSHLIITDSGGIQEEAPSLQASAGDAQCHRKARGIGGRECETCRNRSGFHFP